MRSNLLYFLIFTLYLLYNLMWLTGTMFSYGRNDSSAELVYLFMTFLSDLPGFFYVGLRGRSYQSSPFFLLFALLLAGVTRGRLTSFNYASFDSNGRVLKSNVQINGGDPYTFQYAYDLAGDVISETYPTGRVLNTTYDIAAR